MLFRSENMSVSIGAGKLKAENITVMERLGLEVGAGKAKLKNIHEKYIKEEKAWVDYVKTNKFECYFVDKDPRKEIIPFWSYGPSKLANATDKDWKEYFENAKRMIEERDKLKA